MTGASTVAGGPKSLPLYAMLTASVISLIGNTLTTVALPWFVLQTTGSAAQAGFVGFAQVLPGFLAGIFGGTLVDRFGYKPMSIVSDLVSGIAVATVPLLYHTVGLAFWQLLICVFAGALLDIPGLTARRSMMPELAALAHVPLPRANASFESLQAVSMLLGPPVAGVLIATFGAANVLWIDAATFVASVALVAAAVPSAVRVASRQMGRYRDELLAGLRFIRRDRVLFPMAIVLAISNCLSAPIFAVLLPVFVTRTSGRAADLGLLISAAGIGALTGAMLYGTIGARLPRRLVWIAAFLISPLELWALAFEVPILWALIAMVIAAISVGPTNPLMVTIRHERSPSELRGRVFASYSAIAMVAQPIGMVISGSMIERVGFQPTLFALALCSQVLGLGMLVMPAFRHLEAPAHAAAAPEPVSAGSS